MNKKEIDLSIANYGTTHQLNYDVALLPWGATEPHNQHLPYLTDCILAHDIAVDAAEQLYCQHKIRAMVMPPVFAGAQNPGQRDLIFCVHYRHDTQRAILTDIVQSLHHQGLRKLLIVNGHGGNSFKGMIRDLTTDFPDFIVATSEWFKMAPSADYFDVVGDHADEVETSVMMHYHPELVRLEEAGKGNAKRFAISQLASGRIWIPRNWTLVSEDTGIGDPSRSTAEKGRRFAEAVVDEYVDFLRQFATIDHQAQLYT